MTRDFFLGAIDYGDGHSSECTKQHLIVHFRWMSFTLCESRLNKAVRRDSFDAGPRLL